MLLKILTINADNAMSNDKQMAYLNKLPNSFEQVNHVRCFNHTLQLSAKALLKTFDNPKPGSIDDNNADDDDAQPLDLIAFNNNNNNGFDLFNQNDTDGNGWEDEEDLDEDGEMDWDKEDDADDPMATLPAVDHEALIEDTAVVQTTLDKIHDYLFSHTNGSHHVSDLKTFICCHSIHNHRPACLV